jgi:hypothetical protein
MLCSMFSQIRFPGKSLLIAIVEGSSQLGLRCAGHIPHIVGTNKMVIQEHVSIPSIPGAQIRFDLDKARVLATNVGHNVPNLRPVIYKGFIQGEALSRSSIGTQYHTLPRGLHLPA